MTALPTIPGYELLSCLGGGMLTAVYSARSLETDDLCAVKVLRSDWQDQPTAIKLLQREARACLAVEHAHLVRLTHAHVTRPPYFLVMDMLKGESLRRRLRREYHLEPATGLWIIRQTAEALAALHRAGFVHGDLKPDNIRLVRDGHAILLDLGFAHRPGENAVLLEEGYILGTANYLAPELSAPQPTDDFASDVFSLGLTLFETLTGELPYPAGSALETMRRHSVEEPKDVRRFGLALPAGLAEIIDRLLARDPQDRPRAAMLVQQLITCEIAALSLRKSA